MKKLLIFTINVFEQIFLIFPYVVLIIKKELEKNTN